MALDALVLPEGDITSLLSFYVAALSGHISLASAQHSNEASYLCIFKYAAARLSW